MKWEGLSGREVCTGKVCHIDWSRKVCLVGWCGENYQATNLTKRFAVTKPGELRQKTGSVCIS